MIRNTCRIKEGELVKVAQKYEIAQGGYVGFQVKLDEKGEGFL